MTVQARTLTLDRSDLSAQVANFDRIPVITAGEWTVSNITAAYGYRKPTITG